jgi:DNA-binding NarL/FixJ family response regulator
MGGPAAIVIDQDPRWLAAVARALSDNSMDVVATMSLREASGLVDGSRPGLVALDVLLADGELTSLGWVKAITGRSQPPKVIVLSASDEPGDIDAAFAAGASAYVVKRGNPADVVAAARQLSERSLYLTGLERPKAASHGEEFGLTKREVEILRLAADGLTNNQIATRLWVTAQTVKFHLANAYRKLGVGNRTEAGRLAQTHGLLIAGPEAAPR